jgi:toxin CptA
LRSRLCAENRAAHADAHRTVEFVRIRRHQRHLDFQAHLTRLDLVRRRAGTLPGTQDKTRAHVGGAATLRIDLKPSLKLAALLGAVHLLALAAAWVSLADWPRYLVGSGVLLSGAMCLVEVLQRSSTAALSLELHADGRASWRDRNGTWHEGSLGADRFVSTALVVMGLEMDRGRKWLVLMADSASAEELRRLRLWLRWRQGAGSAKGPEPTPPE